MYKKILVTLDRSGVSEAVLTEVPQLMGTGTQFVFLSVAEEPGATTEAARPLMVAGAPATGGVVPVPPPRVIEDRVQAVERLTNELTDYLEGPAKRLREAGGQVETLVRFGDAAEEIIAAAKETKAELIMMATHGATGLKQVIFGSVAAAVVRGAPVPVLLVRPWR